MIIKCKKAKIIICFLSVFVIVTNIIFLSLRYKKELLLQIDDTNGTSKELCFITDEMISEITEDYRAIKKHVANKDINLNGVKGHFSDCDCSFVETKIGMLSGIYVCNAYIGEGKEVTYTIESLVENGNMRILITDGENTILHDVPIDSKETVTFIAENNKTYYVKFVAESAEIDVTVTREIKAN